MMGVVYRKRMVFTAVSLVFAFMFIFGCNKKAGGLSVESDNFEKKSAVGLVIKKNYVVFFNKSTSQYVYNLKKKSIRIQSDDHSEYVNVTFKDYPNKGVLQVNDVVNVEILYKKGFLSPEKIVVAPMLVLKEEKRKLWLWSEVEKTGLIIDMGMFS